MICPPMAVASNGILPATLPNASWANLITLGILVGIEASKENPCST